MKRGIILSCLCIWLSTSLWAQDIHLSVNDSMKQVKSDSLAWEMAASGKSWNVKGEEISTQKPKEKKSHTNWYKNINYGIKGGFTSSLFLIPHFTVNGVSIDEVQNNYKIGYFGSFFVRINRGKHYLQPEISYNINRCNITFDKPLPEGAPEHAIPEKASIISSIHSIDIPIIYGYNLIKNGPYSLGIFGGPKLRCILTHQSEMKFENFDQKNIQETLRPFNLSATFGVAVTISRVFFDFRYDIGLHNISKKIAYTIESNGEDKETLISSKGMHFHRRDNVLSFSLGVFF